MTAKTILGNATWRCRDASGLCFDAGGHLAATNFDGEFYLFDLTTAKAIVKWKRRSEQLNCVAFDGRDKFLVGGSFGNVYTLVHRGGGQIDLTQEFELFPYVDFLEFGEGPAVLAVVCDSDLKLLRTGQEREAVDVNFPHAIKTIRWSTALDTFLIAAGNRLHSVCP